MPRLETHLFSPNVSFLHLEFLRAIGYVGASFVERAGVVVQIANGVNAATPRSFEICMRRHVERRSFTMHVNMLASDPRSRWDNMRKRARVEGEI